MAGAAFSIKLRCASWPQLATIYRRDLSRGQMFLKASNQPPIGTIVRIDLELPSATVIELQGTIFEHVTDPQRGTGVNLKLDALPTKTVWMIESALAAENKVRAASQGDGAASAQTDGASPSTHDGEEVAAAEAELIRALEAEAESLRKLNPFLVLGVGYETTDSDVRAAFGELTKRYHPDRFIRYQSQKLRQIAAEIFILIRDAYRRLADDKGRQQVLASLGPKSPTRTPTPPRGSGGYPAITPPAAVVPERRSSEKMPALTPPPVPSVPTRARTEPGPQQPRSVAVPPIPAMPKPSAHDIPTKQTPYDAPTNPSAKSAELAHTELARADLAIPVDKPVVATPGPLAGQRRPTPNPTVPLTGPAPVIATPGSLAGQRRPTPAPVELDTSAIETLLDGGKLDEAIAAYRVLQKRHPSDKSLRAGIELVEGLKALGVRDRLEAAQRFEAALELDPSNERAARELAEMRRQATNERKGLLSRLMGKKEP